MTYSRGEVPSPVALADWMNAGRCPTEALHEAGRLIVDLQLAARRAKLGKDVQWGWAEDYRPELGRIEVNADSVECELWACPRIEGWDDDTDTDPSGMADWWNSMPFEDPSELERLKNEWNAWNSKPESERLKRFPLDSVLRAWTLMPFPKDFDEMARPNRVIEDRWSLDSLTDLWNAVPEGERPKHFPLDPVVQAWIESRDSGSPVLNADSQPDRELSLEDYMPDWLRYQKDVGQAVKKDAEEKNGQDVHSALVQLAVPARYKHSDLRTQDNVDLLVGLLRAADCELHQGACPIEQRAAEYIRKLIARLGRLGDLQHGRVLRALDYAVDNAGGRKKYGDDLRRIYRNQRDDGAG